MTEKIIEKLPLANLWLYNLEFILEFVNKNDSYDKLINTYKIKEEIIKIFDNNHMNIINIDSEQKCTLTGFGKELLEHFHKNEREEAEKKIVENTIRYNKLFDIFIKYFEKKGPRFFGSQDKLYKGFKEFFNENYGGLGEFELNSSFYVCYETYLYLGIINKVTIKMGLNDVGLNYDRVYQLGIRKRPSEVYIWDKIDFLNSLIEMYSSLMRAKSGIKKDAKIQTMSYIKDVDNTPGIKLTYLKKFTIEKLNETINKVINHPEEVFESLFFSISSKNQNFIEVIPMRDEEKIIIIHDRNIEKYNLR